jgi:dihydrofolate reductase
MPDTTCHMSISLDGFVAGPDQSRENPLGKRGREVHGWHLGDERANDADAKAGGWLMRPRGACVMGRNMFGPIRGEWDEAWDGWWGSEPPYHAPVFVLTHHAREPIEMEGGTSFHFVTDGFDAAYARAREAAGEDGVDIAGGASTVGRRRSQASVIACPRRDLGCHPARRRRRQLALRSADATAVSRYASIAPGARRHAFPSVVR